MGMTEEEFADLLQLGYEQRGVEFKGPGPLSDNYLRVKVVRAILGMANRRDGGYVFIGVDEQERRPIATGLSDEDLRTWNYDDVADKLARYADPSVRFDLQILRHQNRSFVSIHVQEFEDVPIICKNGFQDHKGKEVLRGGALYVRSRRKPETAEVPTHEDMRELIDLATEKGIRRFVQVVQRAGLSGLSSVVPTDEDLFAQQRSPLGARSLTEKIQSRGYWEVVIRPSAFIEQRIGDFGDLERIVQRSAVEVGGWDFPHVDRHQPLVREMHAVGLDYDWDRYIELWRLYQSGQFVHLSAMPLDWLDRTNLYSRPEGWEPGRDIGVLRTILHFTRIFEFAARLGATPASDEQMVVSMTIGGLLDRQLVVDSPRREPFWHSYTTALEVFLYEKAYHRTDLMGQPRKLALKASQELFLRFGWNAAPEVLEGMQDELFR